ncbi:MAG: non-heme iron oxygenase ferredoxin subunit [Dehalococcoidia bacterium]|nr:non-heme iron oxygenase ferredoxin subunit [Dehalococcoidia bacterium]
MEGFVKVAKTGDLKRGELKLVEVGDERVLLANVGGQLFAVSEVCPHVEGPLSEGPLEGEEVECPWHGSRFNVKTGEVTQSPATEGLKRFAVRVEGDDVLVGPA